MTFSPNIFEIDLSSIVHNLNQVRKLIDPDVRIMGIVKSDAYGHGLVRVSRLLEKNNIPLLGVAHLEEAMELRENGIKLPIVVMCGIKSREDALRVVDRELTPVIFDLESAEYLNREAGKKKKKINTHIKIDTGMSRLGMPYEESGPFFKKIMEYKWLNPEALMSHLSSADEPDHSFTKEQIKAFKSVIGMGREMGLDLPLNHLANSAGVMAHKDSHFSMVRPGIMLYGGCPSTDFIPPLPLRQAASFKSVVIQVRDLSDKTPVSYGRKYHAVGPKKIAVIAAGYGDGLSRRLSNRGKVLIRGEKADIVGTVCMNMSMCDASGIRDVAAGDEAVILGPQGNEIITGDDMAGWCDTISYEIFTSIGQINSRKYK